MDDSIVLSHLDKNEALRYLGYRGASPDEGIESLLDICQEEVIKIARPRFVYKVFEFEVQEDGVAFKGTNLKLLGNSIKEHLKGCELAICFAATISEGIDRQIRVLEHTDMAKALVFDSLSSVAVEQVCNKLEEKLAQEYSDYYQTFRFGIGYGDLPLSHQPDFLKVLNAPKVIGVNIGKSYMMTPTKSVTAVIGLSKEVVKGKNKGCATCNMYDRCTMRKAGGHCNE